MFGYLALGIFAYIVYFVVNNYYYRLQKNIKIAKETGIHYVLVPVFFLWRPWLILHPLLLPALRLLPSKYTEWVDFVLPDFAYNYRYEIFKRTGHDTFLTVAPGGIMMHTCEPAVVTQITTRRNDFPKPTHIYRSVDIYGKNVVSTEGQAWRHHRKATSPPFTEKNNHLVWAESIDQAISMVASWTISPSEPVTRVMDDTMRLSLNVISQAGFGRKMPWPTTETQHKEDENYVDLSKIKNEVADIDPGHSMSYTYAIHCLLDNILFQFLLPRWTLRWSPLKRMKKANEAYLEWGAYMKEMLTKKQQSVAAAKVSGVTEQMDIVTQMVKSLDSGGSGKSTSPSLTESEVLGNMFVLILAGHETAANSIHFSMLYLALHPQSQRLLQKDLDNIFQGRPPSEWDYDRDLPALFGGMAGAVLAEELRLVPPVTGVPKSTFDVGPQKLTVEGRECTVPAKTYISLATTSAQRNPTYWPTHPPTLPGGHTVHPTSNIDNDLEEFHPERWLLSSDNPTTTTSSTSRPSTPAGQHMPSETLASGGGDTLNINESSDTSSNLYRPQKGAYFPFSEGYRSCLGRRFAQVEVLAVLAVIFQSYSVELDTSLTSPSITQEELIAMDVDEKAEHWQKAAERVRELMLNGMGVIITLQMRKGTVNLRLRKRGEEAFEDDVDGRWKRGHPGWEERGGKGQPGWKCWKERGEA